jgi:predicted ferric reductase
MARHAAHAKLPTSITLFYSNRRPEDAAFLGELLQLEKTNPNFRLVATITAAQDSAQPWSGEIGLISHEMLRRYLPNVLAPIYYFAGPARWSRLCGRCSERSASSNRTCVSRNFTAIERARPGNPPIPNEGNIAAR